MKKRYRLLLDKDFIVKTMVSINEQKLITI